MSSNPEVLMEITIRNYFDSVYKPKGLNNWELPKWYPPRPRQRKGSTKLIANDRGHLLDNSKKTDQNPWGNFRNTYQLPDKINRNFVDKYNKCLLKKEKFASFPQDTSTCDIDNNDDLGISGKGLSYPTKCETTEHILSFDPNRNKRLHSCDKKESLDLEYTPGDFTQFKNQHPSRDFLLEDKYKRDRNIEPDLILNKNFLGDHDCKLGECEPPPIKLTPLLPPTSSALATSELSPKLRDLDLGNKYNIDTHEDYLSNKEQTKMFSSHSITEKPNERCPSPVVPAYANFELAKRMHSNNLDHQPLPDCVADLAFRRLQITGDNPGLALDIEPIATGVGVKTHNAGPTHCTKMKVYRPKTGGVVPRAYNGNNTRSYSATPGDKKMGAMDLAICWDYKPPYEPARPKHIDGSNDSAGPAVFTYVKSPRDDAISNTGRSAGVFTNTLGETGFFDKDILSRKTDFAGRKIATDDFSADVDLCPTFPRARSFSRDSSACHRLPQTRFSKQYKSTPDIMADHEYKALREKYLGADCTFPNSSVETGCKRSGFLRKARSRMCHKIAPETNCFSRTCSPKRMTCKAAFRAGIPRYNAAGNFISSDSGCSFGSNHSQRVLVVPRPRNPYSKRNYDIDTLVPPFRSYAGGAGEGGYPEHWRLSSVYQHAYKPLECRRKPLLQTVYK